jgi:hypothetical protein
VAVHCSAMADVRVEVWPCIVVLRQMCVWRCGRACCAMADVRVEVWPCMWSYNILRSDLQPAVP